MVKLLVIADDLTGANDAGAQFAGQGISTLVAMEAEFAFDQRRPDPTVLVISSESRHLNPAAAAARVESLTRRGRELGVSHFYKKTDSTLRGNIGAELEALLRASKREVLAFAPAFPSLGRTTRGGYQYVGGRLLHQSEFAADPLNPIATSFIPEILRSQTDLPTRVFGRNAGDLSIQTGERPWIAVFDAENDEDFQPIGQLLRRRGLLGALAGSAGFAVCLPQLLGLSVDFTTTEHSSSGPILVVSGSLNDVSLRQTARGESTGFVVLNVPVEALIGVDGGDRTAAARMIEELIGHAADGKDVILRTAARREDVENSQRLGDRSGLRDGALHQRVAEGVAALVREVLAETKTERLVVFGGDTLAAIMRAMGWRALLPMREMLPGVILAETVGGEKSMTLISKAGGFGPVDLLQKIKTRLRENS
jgi:D-threonate/D-erythronate kinase